MKMDFPVLSLSLSAFTQLAIPDSDGDSDSDSKGLGCHSTFEADNLLHLKNALL